MKELGSSLNMSTHKIFAPARPPVHPPPQPPLVLKLENFDQERIEESEANLREARWKSFTKAWKKIHGDQVYDPAATLALTTALQTGEREAEKEEEAKAKAFALSKSGRRTFGDGDMGGDMGDDMMGDDMGDDMGDVGVQSASKTKLSSHQKLLIEQELVIDKSNYMEAIKSGEMVCITKLKWSNQVMSAGSRRRRLDELGSENHHGPLKRRLAGGADDC